MTDFKINQLQPQLVQTFDRIIAEKRLAHAYLFEGEKGTGKVDLATWIAMRLFCQHVEDGQPDGTCPECQRVLTGNHPDFIRIQPDGQRIKVDAVRYFKAEISKSGMESSRRIFVIEDAEKLTTGAANSLLKFLEEPAANILTILTTSAKNQILPTVLSRLQIVHFPPLARPVLIKEIQDQQIATTSAPLLAHLTNDLGVAKEWMADDYLPQLTDKVWQWAERVLKHDDEAFVLVQTQLMPAAKDKEQVPLVLQVLELVFRDLLNVRYNVTDDLSFPAQQTQLKQWSQRLTTQQLVAMQMAVLEARKQRWYNVSLQNVLESLTLKLLQIATNSAGRSAL
ncbi:holB protein [Lactobacillus selangorensis]|uniref:HolB protein n=1 Tax=Lactobacillus selangorensis TaxID=81857 RepID=A0A0R2G193_9LACO|nr:DNA polymerase III subunit delta' [Lactobacillus selangorensis]KRN27420.1 holB protein [Lactobacillus selangorensis]KRN31383.1 holB protein [Lactobacillus selangorensis]